MAASASLAVVYLARKAEGLEAPARFLASYRRNAAGCPHDLVLILKGFERCDPQKTRLETMFAGHALRSVEIDDSGVDITAYLHSGSVLPHETLCFLNTFSVIASPGWLATLARHLARDGIGMVGASGSYESLRASTFLLSKVVWLCATGKIPFDHRLARHYRWLLRAQFPAWLDAARLDRWRSFLSRRPDYRPFEAAYAAFWEAMTQPGAPLHYVTDHPGFPNPHIRSNAFMIRRARLLACGFAAIHGKTDSFDFESGHGSLTSKIRQRGEAVLVVGKDGRAYGVADWPGSRTFRLGDQGNLLVTDNQVSTFDRLPRAERATHARMTWGDYATRSDAVPTLGVGFPRAPDGL